MFEINIKFMFFYTHYDLLQQKMFSPFRGAILQIFKHKTPTKEETAEKKEQTPSLKHS
jgi:hypothetical protein